MKRRKVKLKNAKVWLSGRRFIVPEPDSGSADSSGATRQGDFKSALNPHSLEVVKAKCEPSLKDARPEPRYQIERFAYFALDKDSQLSTNNPQLVFNRTITLKDRNA